ncbi:btb/poz domain-containing [Anaeramoeba flamelloides]|uniref:Btb/poz domain-containing n=1 Tax=Anaeramoeba flamelloides TaxID=1746091 RepID=A0AAV8A6V0_9EUKA|nr:btb/poz domain-containing [Anaeramoeba flamelloides]
MTFVYQRDIEIHFNNAFDLYMISKQFHTFDLDKLSVKWIKQNIRQKNALRFLNKPIVLNLPHLISMLIDYVSKNTNRIFSSRGCLNKLSNETIIEIIKNPFIKVSQFTLLFRLIERGKYLCDRSKKKVNPINIRNNISKFLPLINFKIIPLNKILEIKKNFHFLSEELDLFEKKIQNKVDKQKKIKIEKQKVENKNERANINFPSNFANPLSSDHFSSNLKKEKPENKNKANNNQEKEDENKRERKQKKEKETETKTETDREREKENDNKKEKEKKTIKPDKYSYSGEVSTSSGSNFEIKVFSKKSQNSESSDFLVYNSESENEPDKTQLIIEKEKGKGKGKN